MCFKMDSDAVQRQQSSGIAWLPGRKSSGSMCAVDVSFLVRRRRSRPCSCGTPPFLLLHPIKSTFASMPHLGNAFRPYEKGTESVTPLSRCISTYLAPSHERSRLHSTTTLSHSQTIVSADGNQHNQRNFYPYTTHIVDRCRLAHTVSIEATSARRVLSSPRS